MHEYAIVGALVGRVEAEAAARGASAVARLEVAIGELSGVETTLLATAWEIFRQRTVCAAAELVLTAVPARWACRKCRRDLARGGPLRCPQCGGPGRLVAGDEIMLNRIELEVPDV